MLIGIPLYKTLFWSDPKIVLTTSKLPSEIFQKISIEENLPKYSKESDDPHLTIEIVYYGACGMEFMVEIEINPVSVITYKIYKNNKKSMIQDKKD